MVMIANAKAHITQEIKCAASGQKDMAGRAVKCPPGRGESGNKFRGVHKCWGCPSAVWSSGSLKGQPYGPRRRRMF